MHYTEDFLSVYEHYPLKKGKFQAQKTWNKLSDKGDLPEIKNMIKAIANQKKERSFLKNQNRFVPQWKHFSTWLNAGCWDDECEFQASRTPTVRKSNGIQDMQRAFNILCNVGEKKFHEFCRSVGMPDNDKEAVWNKYNLRFDAKKLAKGMLKSA